MASQALKNEQAWKKYTEKLAEAGFSPPETLSRQYQRERDYWDTWDPDESRELNKILSTPTKE